MTKKYLRPMQDKQAALSGKVENDTNKLGKNMPTAKNEGRRTPLSRSDREDHIGLVPPVPMRHPFVRHRLAQVTEVEPAGESELAALRAPSAVGLLHEELRADQEAAQPRIAVVHGLRQQRGCNDAAGDIGVDGFSHGVILLTATTSCHTRC